MLHILWGPRQDPEKSGVPMSLTGCLSPLLTEDMGWGGGLPCPHSPSSQPQIVAWEVGGRLPAARTKA